MSDIAELTDRGYLTYLRRLLVQRFSISELRTLCFDLEVDAETLPGNSNKLDLVRGMVDHLERRQRIPELVAYLSQIRDDLQLKPIPPSAAGPVASTDAAPGINRAMQMSPPEAPLISMRDPHAVWSYGLPGQPMTAPVVLGDVCLIASQESGRGSPGGVLRALSVTSGEVRWEQRFPNAVVGGLARTTERTVLVSLPSLGRLPGESALIAVDGNGRIVWSTELEVHQISAPAVSGGIAAVTGNSHAVLALDARSGELLAEVSLPVDVALSAPACAGSAIYVPCRAPSLVAVTLAGDLLWRHEVDGVLSGVQISQTPLVVGDLVIAVLSSGAVLALTRRDGRQVWESQIGPRGKQLTTPVTDGRQLYVGARDGVYALRPGDGATQWVFHTGAYVTAAPVVAGNVLCIAGNDRHLYGLDPSTGKLLWQHTMSQETKTSPALTEGDGEGPYAIVVDCTGGVTGLTYPVSVADHERAGRWSKAAKVWEAQNHPRRAAEAWCRHAESLGESEATADGRAQAWATAAHLFDSVSAIERAAEARRRYAQVLGLPLIVVDVQHGGLALDAWSRLRLVIRNGGYGLARSLIIRVAGEQFEGQIVETQTLAALPVGQGEEQILDVKPLAHGDSVPLRFQIDYLDDNGEPHRREETIHLPVAKEMAKKVPGTLRILSESGGALDWAGALLALPTVDLEIRIGNGARDYSVEVTLNGGQVFSGGQLSRTIVDWVPTGDLVADGHHLFEGLFRNGAVRKAWHVARGQAQQQGALRRIRLRIDDDVSELQRLPWELLHDDEVMLSACEATPFSRYLPVERPVGTPVVDRPIRVLAAVANPRDLAQRYDLPPIDVKMEKYLLAKAFAGIDPDQIRLDFLPSPVTLEALSRAMGTVGGYHWLHLVGHGRFNTRQERMDLLLEDERGSTRAIAGHLLCRMLAHQGGQPQLVYLSVCQSAVGPDGHVLAGLAAKLVEVGVPAVVAMRNRVQMRSAQRIVQAFYESLARHGMPDRALNQARDALLSADLPGVESPVLFMRLPSGKLWQAE